MARAETRGKSAQSKGKATKSRKSTQAKGKSAKSTAKSSGKSAQARKSTKSSGGSARKGTAARKTASGGRSNPTTQAIELLTEDHRMVQKLFKQGQKKREDTQALQEIVQQACDALTLHAEMEEQYFYPMMREEADEQDMIAEAEVEHASAKQLIAELEQMNAEDERYAATFKVLGEYVNHHIEEEEKQIFPKARKAKLDLSQLQQALEQRGQEPAEGSDATMGAGADDMPRGGGRSRSVGRGGDESTGMNMGGDDMEDQPRGGDEDGDQERAPRQGRGA